MVEFGYIPIFWVLVHYHDRTVNASDRDLILACRKGKRGAWESVLDKYERLVFSISLNYGLSRDDAADITQLTFTILVQSLDSLDDDSRLGPWLATVARRHTWRLMERNRRESTGRVRDLAESATLLGKRGDESVERWELIEWLNQGLSLIDESCRRLLLALYFDPQQPTYAEVADRLNKPVGSIGPTRARCLERLKRVLAEK
jgi:RNA polymerase sigma factor (sigma-70 family)